MSYFRAGPATNNKFRAVKTELDGHRFDSKAEAKRYSHLKLLERIGEISELELQPQYDFVINGMKVCSYLADFRYRMVASGDVIVEDVKSAPTRTPEYRIKNKLMKAVHGIDVVEVMK